MLFLTNCEFMPIPACTRTYTLYSYSCARAIRIAANLFAKRASPGGLHFSPDIYIMEETAPRATLHNSSVSESFQLLPSPFVNCRAPELLTHLYIEASCFIRLFSTLPCIPAPLAGGLSLLRGLRARYNGCTGACAIKLSEMEIERERDNFEIATRVFNGAEEVLLDWFAAWLSR